MKVSFSTIDEFDKGSSAGTCISCSGVFVFPARALLLEQVLIGLPVLSPGVWPSRYIGSNELALS